MKASARTWFSVALLLSVGAALANACSAGGDTSSGSGALSSGTGGGGAASSGGSSGDGGANTSVGSSFVSGSGGMTSGTGGNFGGSCGEASSVAEGDKQPADIIIAVDTSGSMSEESAQVQQNLNDFATIITSSGIDVHVVLIADATVCIPTPLGSGTCNGADEALPNYRHVVQTVSSTDGLQVILNTYPQWKDSLRPEATKTFLMVTDDNSDLSAADFTSALLALDPPTFQDFKFDGIFAPTSPDTCLFQCIPFPGNGCTNCMDPCCDKSELCAPIQAEQGTVYLELVQQTQGVQGNLCLQSFGPVFQDMATGVILNSTISCDYPIPPNPDGDLDPAKVNVEHTPEGSTTPNPIYNVPGGLDDCGPAGGWYYDNPQNPTTIVMCPATCDGLQGAGGKVVVIFGCETAIGPPG